MAIEELKTKKRDLECAICEMLRNFEVETQFVITDVEYTTKAYNSHDAFDFKITLEI